MVAMMVLPWRERRLRSWIDTFGVVRGEARSGLIEEEDGRIGDEFHGDIDALALAAAEDFVFGRADDGVFFVGEIEFAEEIVDACFDFVVGEIGAQAGGKIEGFADGEFGVDDVVLGDVGELLAEAIEVAIKIQAVE